MGLLATIKPRFTYTFTYVIVALLIMNFDIILVSLEHEIVMNTPNYTEKKWDRLSDEQKEHVQSKLNCCGFKDKNDRSVSDCNGVGCKDVFIEIVEGVKKKSERFVFGVFVLKSLSLAVLCMFMRKRRKGKSKNLRRINVVKQKENNCEG